METVEVTPCWLTGNHSAPSDPLVIGPAPDPDTGYSLIATVGCALAIARIKGNTSSARPEARRLTQLRFMIFQFDLTSTRESTVSWAPFLARLYRQVPNADRLSAVPAAHFRSD